MCTGQTGHAEAVLVAYDPSRITYEELLRVFWESHDPTQAMRQGNDVGTQYRSLIQVSNDEERRIAEASRDAYQEMLSKAGYGEIMTEITERTPFYYAGLPPGVSRQGPERLLPQPRDGRKAPRRLRGHAAPVRRLSSAVTTGAGQTYSRAMTVLRMDNVLLVVDDLEAAKAFFADLGLELEGETVVEGLGRPPHRARQRPSYHRFDADPGRPRAD